MYTKMIEKLGLGQIAQLNVDRHRVPMRSSLTPGKQSYCVKHTPRVFLIMSY